MLEKKRILWINQCCRWLPCLNVCTFAVYGIRYMHEHDNVCWLSGVWTKIKKIRSQVQFSNVVRQWHMCVYARTKRNHLIAYLHNICNSGKYDVQFALVASHRACAAAQQTAQRPRATICSVIHFNFTFAISHSCILKRPRRFARTDTPAIIYACI